jgi:hypothetical protein
VGVKVSTVLQLDRVEVAQNDDKRHTVSYDHAMKPFSWSTSKNERLKAERQISFDEIVVAIEEGGVLDVLAHSNSARYPNQRILVVRFAGYVYLVPYVEDAECYFLKTVIPSRKATRDYLGHGEFDG